MAKYRGVKRNKVGHWVASICHKGKQTYLGSFASAKEAAIAVDDARMERFGGEWYKLNIPDRHDPPTHKLCRRCGKKLRIRDFAMKRSSVTGRNYPVASCRACQRRRQRAEVRAYTRKHGASSHVQFRRKSLRNRISVMLSKIRYRSRGRTQFSLTIDYVLDLYEKQAGLCALTGRPMRSAAGEGKSPDDLSIDRIDNTKGYVPGNVQLVRVVVNRAKQEMSMKEFVQLCQDVVRLSRTQ